MARVFLDAEGNPIKQGFYTNGVMCGIYYFEEQTNTVKEGVIPELNEEAECWKVHKEDESGLETLSIDSTHGSRYGFYPLSNERVRKRVGFLRERADWLEGRL